MADDELQRRGGGPPGSIPVSELTLALKQHIEGAFRRVCIIKKS